MARSVITFKPKQVTKKLVAVLGKRAQDVIVRRYGLGTEGEKETLEAIGADYSITRERVRQIEQTALTAIRKSTAYTDALPVLDELRKIMITMGGIVPEHDFLHSVAPDKGSESHIHFLLVLGEFFVKHRENEDFHHRWTADQEVADRVHESIKKLYASLSDDELLEEGEVLSRFLRHLEDINEEYKNEEVLRRWLGMAKRITKNPLGEWGVADSPNVRTRGVRDLAFLVLRRHGSPMHFTEVAKAIADTFDREAHTATTHNELIKDKRFVLVGRGLYALREWGYASGVVRDVIRDILTKYGPMTKDEIVAKVLRERYVKPNTVLVNLQGDSEFKRRADGKYEVAKA